MAARPLFEAVSDAESSSDQYERKQARKFALLLEQQFAMLRVLTAAVSQLSRPKLVPGTGTGPSGRSTCCTTLIVAAAVLCERGWSVLVCGLSGICKKVGYFIQLFWKRQLWRSISLHRIDRSQRKVYQRLALAFSYRFG